MNKNLTSERAAVYLAFFGCSPLDRPLARPPARSPSLAARSLGSRSRLSGCRPRARPHRRRPPPSNELFDERRHVCRFEGSLPTVVQQIRGALHVDMPAMPTKPRSPALDGVVAPSPRDSPMIVAASGEEAVAALTVAPLSASAKRPRRSTASSSSSSNCDARFDGVAASAAAADASLLSIKIEASTPTVADANISPPAYRSSPEQAAEEEQLDDVAQKQAKAAASRDLKRASKTKSGDQKSAPRFSARGSIAARRRTNLRLCVLRRSCKDLVLSTTRRSRAVDNRGAASSSAVIAAATTPTSCSQPKRSLLQRLTGAHGSSSRGEAIVAAKSKTSIDGSTANQSKRINQVRREKKNHAGGRKFKMGAIFLCCRFAVCKCESI